MDNLPAIRKDQWLNWASAGIAAVGLALYLLQAWAYIHTNIPGLDEGAYLYKGYLFTSGEYKPFGPGILTNKAPLAFLIPGYVQMLFGAGLRTGRFFALISGLLVVLGTYLTARRFAGQWLAAGGIWVFALSPMIIKTYSGAVSEAPVAAMLVWMLYFILGNDRKTWQLALGSGLSALLVLTRQNMVIVPALMMLYLMWQYGWKKTLTALIPCVAILIIGHALFWPDILQMWAPWLPGSLTPFLDPFRPPSEALASWNPSIDWLGRTTALFQGLRYHMIIVFLSISAVILVKKGSDWKDQACYRSFVFLVCLYFGLLLLHAWAAVGSKYDYYSCVYCFTPYLSFFAPAGVLVAVLGYGSWKMTGTVTRILLSCLFVIVLFAGAALSAFEDYGSTLLNFPFPRVKEGKLLPGWITIWDLLSNKLSMEVAEARKFASFGAGILLAITIMILAYLIWRRYPRADAGYSHYLLTCAACTVFIITPLFGGSLSRPDCQTDVIILNENAGEYLSKIIPKGSLIYWEGGLSVVPMLYLPGRNLFPPQINDGYAYLNGGEPAELLKFGYWNYELAKEWLEKADYFIVEEWRYPGWQDHLQPDQYEEFERTPEGTSCLKGTRLRIFTKST